MEWAGFFALALILCYSSYPGKVKRLESRVKALEKKQRGVESMSKMIEGLIGKTCKLKLEAGTDLSCTILDADDEWVKLSYEDKKSGSKTRMLRIDAIEEIELSND